MELSTPYFEKVIKIQEIETNILKEKKEILSLEEKRKSVEDKFNEISNELLELENEMKNLMIQKKENEIILSEIEEEIKKHQAELNQAKKEEVYKALNLEIENDQKRKDEIETKIIMLIDEIENKNSKISEKRKEVSENKKIKEETLKLVEKEIEVRKNKIELLESEKKEIENSIPDNNLKNKVKELLKNKNGLAIVKADVIQNGTKTEYYCSGCKMKLNASDVNSIKKPNTFVICQNCSRMIHI
jgi:predicted  nucleic acid-binding Zn-ribbon protein